MDKKIEPTEAMIRDVESWSGIIGVDDVALLRYALNHPDARGLFADEDDRPWEPLDEGAPLHVGDEVRRDHCGIITTGVVARVDEDGDPLTADGYLIGLRDYGTWHVRRAVQELPEEDGAVIVPAEGREFIEAEVAGQTFIAREAVVCQSDFGPANVLEGAWRRVDDGSRVGGQVSRGFITPGTWKVEGE